MHIWAADSTADLIDGTIESKTQMLCRLLPMLVVDLKNSPCTIALATDASMTGGGVTTRGIPEESWFEFSSFRQKRGWYTVARSDHVSTTAVHQHTELTEFPRSCEWFLRDFESWKTEVATKWNFNDEIAILEFHALQLGLRNLVSHHCKTSVRPVIFVDSAAVVGSLAKGRSSSNRLNTQCRKVAAIICASDLRPIWIWIPSHMNPADRPSRRFEDKD
jgi:hypothetical protein